MSLCILAICPLLKFHDIAGVPNLMVSPFVRNEVEGDAKPVANKSPISSEELTSLGASVIP